jgi:Protein of unknown function (DUF3102)
MAGLSGVKRMGAARLDELALALKHKYELGTAKMAIGISHYGKCGQMLLEAKAQIEHGRWQSWVETSLPFGLRQAEKYMRIARNLGDAFVNANPDSHLSVQDAINLLANPAKKKPRKLRPMRPGDRRDGNSFAFEPPDLTALVRHLVQQWPPCQVQRYEPDDEQLGTLDVDLPVLLPALVELGERLGLDIGVRLAEPPPAPTVLEGEPVIIDGKVLEIEAVPDLAQAHELYQKALLARDTGTRVQDLRKLMDEAGMRIEDLTLPKVLHE